jgi:hypothetical protein
MGVSSRTSEGRDGPWNWGREFAVKGSQDLPYIKESLKALARCDNILELARASLDLLVSRHTLTGVFSTTRPLQRHGFWGSRPDD